MQVAEDRRQNGRPRTRQPLPEPEPDDDTTNNSINQSIELNQGFDIGRRHPRRPPLERTASKRP